MENVVEGVIDSVKSGSALDILPETLLVFTRLETLLTLPVCSGTSRIIPAFHRFLQFQPMDDKAGLDEVRQEFVGKWKELTKEMDETGPFFFGEEPSLIDFVIAPWAVSMVSCVKHSGDD